MKNIKLYKLVLFWMLFASPFATMAADDVDGGNGDGDVQDVPAASIDDYIPLALIIAIGMSYKLVYRKINKTT